MNLCERTVGQYRIYAAALEAPTAGGFFAAVVVRPLRSGGRSDSELFRDERLDDGRVWTSAEDALSFGLQVGTAALRAQQVVRHLSVGQPGALSPLPFTGEVDPASSAN